MQNSIQHVYTPHRGTTEIAAIPCNLVAGGPWKVLIREGPDTVGTAGGEAGAVCGSVGTGKMWAYKRTLPEAFETNL